MSILVYPAHIVIPAKAGIQTGFTGVLWRSLDSRLRGNDIVLLGVGPQGHN